MVGEYDFNDTFTIDKISAAQVIQKEGWLRQAFPVFVQIVFIFLLLFVTIIIANLIIGLTVSNTMDLSQEANIYKLDARAQNIQNVDNFINQLGCMKTSFPEKIILFVKQIAFSEKVIYFWDK